MSELPRDLRTLCEHVCAQIPRLMTLQDKDPDSPMRGCLHPAYWRDKSSELADMRRQEAALAFALTWRHPLPGNRHRGDPEVLRAALRAMGFWVRQQNADGTFDEWYRGEHGYAATAFSTVAMSLAQETLGDALPPERRREVVHALERTSRWLLKHDDLFKTNHQAVGVAALGAASRVLEDPALAEAAEVKARGILDGLHEEGWAREITGADLGYTSLLCEYLALFVALTGRTALLPGIRRAWRFGLNFVHPDLTTGAEYGICANPYFSRVATVLLAPHDAGAAGLLEWMKEPRLPADPSATLHDDLRLARYAFQPLLAALLFDGTIAREDRPEEPVAPAPPPFVATDGHASFPEAGLLAVARPGYVAYAAPCHGGFLRVFFRDGAGFRPAVAHRGYRLGRGDEVYRNARYDRSVRGEFVGSEMRVEAPLGKVGFVMPPYWARVGLRIATSTPYGPKWSRWLIDRWRARKGTALNQSAAGVGAGKAEHRLVRIVRFHADHLELVDRLEGAHRAPPEQDIAAVVDGPLRTPGGTRADEDRTLAGLRRRTDGGAVIFEQVLEAGPEGAVLRPA